MQGSILTIIPMRRNRERVSSSPRRMSLTRRAVFAVASMVTVLVGPAFAQIEEYTDESLWLADAGFSSSEDLTFTAENVLLADEVTTLPTHGVLFPDPALTFASANTGLPFSYRP